MIISSDERSYAKSLGFPASFANIRCDILNSSASPQERSAVFVGERLKRMFKILCGDIDGHLRLQGTSD